MNHHSPFHDSHRDPLPDANAVERQVNAAAHSSPAPPGGDRRQLRRLFMLLLLVGLVLGCATAAGVVVLLDRLDMLDGPAPQEQLQL